VSELRRYGFTACKEHVERLMFENDIRACHKRRYKVTTDSRHGLPVAENPLDRNFMPPIQYLDHWRVEQNQEKTGCIKFAQWQTKNRGILSHAQEIISNRGQSENVIIAFF
jgi:hypothetical protein